MAKTITLLEEDYLELKEKAGKLDILIEELKEADLDKLKKELEAWEELSDEALENFERNL